MQADAPISVSEYLSTSYRPDCDLMDGVIVERNVGEKDHSKLQTRLTMYLGVRAKQWRIHVLAHSAYT
jgi:hypothetical protein